jgi:hypothetical protein
MVCVGHIFLFRSAYLGQSCRTCSAVIFVRPQWQRLLLPILKWYKGDVSFCCGQSRDKVWYPGLIWTVGNVHHVCCTTGFESNNICISNPKINKSSPKKYSWANQEMLYIPAFTQIKWSLYTWKVYVRELCTIFWGLIFILGNYSIGH